MYTIRFAVLTVAACLIMSGCKSKSSPKAEKPAASNAASSVAVARIRPSQLPATRPALGNPTGTVTFTQNGDQVMIVADLTGLPPNSTRGFHIHEKGDLSDPGFTKAGGHYNPQTHQHGSPLLPARHAGDLGNIASDAEGRAHLELTVDNISVNGEMNPIVGRAVIIHAKVDDLQTQPTGNSGERIGGGVIELAQ
jgi:Cu-Zn family superoxide dismutase